MLSTNATLILHALANGHCYGFDLMRVAQLPSGTVYPLLRRLEAGGLLSSRWEQNDPAEDGRPRRRYYKLTASGRKALGEALPRVRAQWRVLGLDG
jgi:DNA-binding PadR family transcriptional regulator